MATTYDQLVVRIAETKHELAQAEAKYRDAFEGAHRGQPDEALADQVAALKLKLHTLEQELDSAG